ncbi:MAG: DegT/DnrJ/EryC1/StrS family aminotransferase, partial [Acidobacteria bacterium]|nr:DegT/DnrJ/EryC1/StrS family aminotransferase [Acidobacteriota bacterium]
MTDTPALLGGSPAVTLDQHAANRWPVLEADDEAAVLEVMRHGDLSNHVVTRHLEDDFRARLGCRHALAHANGTLGLLAAFHALNLSPGDEVLVPSATFWASVVPMLWVGAVPVFCEIEGERFALDPADVERRITPRTRAMVIVHLWGLPAKVDALLDIARRHGLAVIEDASHALGAVSDGVPCGRFGDISVFSLQTSKLAAAG